MILVTVGAGIGAGIIIDGVLYRGGSEAAGEIGNLIPGREFLGKNYQEFGALESVASGTGIAEHARASLRSQRDAVELESLSADDVFSAASQNRKWALSVIEEAVEYLAIAIANLTVSFDPDLIVLGGSVAPFANMLIKPILERINGSIPALPRLVVSNLGLRAGVMGAITNILHNTANFYLVRKLS
jgi:predicted NBD/HSP70 family sugar kinase